MRAERSIVPRNRGKKSEINSMKIWGLHPTSVAIIKSETIIAALFIDIVLVIGVYVRSDTRSTCVHIIISHLFDIKKDLCSEIIVYT